MKKRQRRKFSSEFKLKVILESLKERSTLTELSQKYELHSNQISKWKADFLEKAADVMDSKPSAKTIEERDAELEKLYSKIGQLQIENDFLKKKLFK